MLDFQMNAIPHACFHMYVIEGEAFGVEEKEILDRLCLCFYTEVGKLLLENRSLFVHRLFVFCTEWKEALDMEAFGVG